MLQKTLKDLSTLASYYFHVYEYIEGPAHLEVENGQSGKMGFIALHAS